MRIIGSIAMSLDGCLDGAGDQPLVLSSTEDLQAIDVLRASVDAIMVGANTIRRDNPSLLVKSPELISLREQEGRSPQPARLVLSRTGQVPAKARVLHDQKAETTMIVSERALAELFLELSEQYSTILVEGGGSLMGQLLTEGLVDLFRLAIAPILVGSSDAPRISAMADTAERLLTVDRTEHFGDTAVVWFRKKA